MGGVQSSRALLGARLPREGLTLFAALTSAPCSTRYLATSSLPFHEAT